MGRTRVIESDRILDAAQAVVARVGASRMTVATVAAEAGISKASVLYDYKTKQALIEAVVRRTMDADNAFNQAATASLGQGADAIIRGRIAAAVEPLPQQSRAAALALCAALAEDSQLRKLVQENQAAVIDRILKDSGRSGGALLAYLALEGVKLLESLDFHTFAPAMRNTLLQEIAWIVDQQPVPVAISNSSVS